MDDNRLVRIESKIDRLSETLSQQNTVLAQHSLLHERNTKDLEHHIKRTDLLEDSFKPLKQTDTILRACLKGIAILATLLTIVYTITRLLGI